MAGKTGTVFKLTLVAFILITAAALMSIRTFPTQGEVGWQSIVFCILAIVMYLIPASLVSAELATGWPQEGGVYVWVKEAFGERWGFTAVWLQWFQMTIGFISILTFIAATFSFLFNPALANNKIYEFIVIVVIWWGLTFINFRGLKSYARVSSWSVVLGTFIPAAVLIVGGLWYILAGNPVQLTLHPVFADFIPNLSSLSNLVLLVTFVFVFIGIEMTATHAKEIKDVQKNYPMGILVVGILMAVVSIIGALIVAMLVPVNNLNLLAGIMQSFSVIFTSISPALAHVYICHPDSYRCNRSGLDMDSWPGQGSFFHCRRGHASPDPAEGEQERYPDKHAYPPGHPHHVLGCGLRSPARWRKQFVLDALCAHNNRLYRHVFPHVRGSDQTPLQPARSETGVHNSWRESRHVDCSRIRLCYDGLPLLSRHAPPVPNQGKQQFYVVHGCRHRPRSCYPPHHLCIQETGMEDQQVSRKVR